MCIRDSYGPGASQHDVVPAGSPTQPAIPQRYRDASPEELDAMIRAAKQTLGDRVVCLLYTSRCV